MTGKLTIDWVGYGPCRRNALVGFCDIRIREQRLIIHDAAYKNFRPP
jgi:hypothetical protein